MQEFTNRGAPWRLILWILLRITVLATKLCVSSVWILLRITVLATKLSVSSVWILLRITVLATRYFRSRLDFCKNLCTTDLLSLNILPWFQNCRPKDGTSFELATTLKEVHVATARHVSPFEFL